MTELGEGAFRECVSLKHVELPGRIEKIGKDAFLDCTALESISFPQTIKEIGENAFRNCTSLASVTGLPDSTECKRYAFRDSLYAKDRCPNCGGELKSTFFLLKCMRCGKLKDY